jgi:large subunit ribosomal protein L10
MATEAKVATVAEIAEKFRNSTAAVVTEYRGLKVSQLSKLRSDLGSEVAYTVAKNTLVRRAATEAGVQGLDELFNGPTAIAFITGEPVTAAKALRDFAKTNELLVIKGGVMDGKILNPYEVTKLADLESREVLLAKFAGAMKASLTQAAVMFNQLPAQVARLAAALQEKKVAAGETAEVADPDAAVVPADVAEAPEAAAPDADAAAPDADAAVPEVAQAAGDSDPA